MLVVLLADCPDALDADMVRFFGRWDWRSEPPSRVAPLAATAFRQPESWMRRRLDPDWQWTVEAQLLGLLFEALTGKESGRPRCSQSGDGGYSGEDVNRVLAAERSAV